MTDKLTEELFAFFCKFIIIPLLAVGVKLSVTSMNGGKISRLNVALSFFVGIAIPFILKDVIEAYVSEDWTTATIGMIAILSDKIAESIIKRVQIDVLISSLCDNLFTFIISTFKPRK